MVGNLTYLENDQSQKSSFGVMLRKRLEVLNMLEQLRNNCLYHLERRGGRRGHLDKESVQCLQVFRLVPRIVETLRDSETISRL